MARITGKKVFRGAKSKNQSDICRMNLHAPERIQNFIGGSFRDPIGEAWMDNVNPATGVVYSHTPDSDERDVDFAAGAAKAAFTAWSTTPAEERFKVLNRIAELIEQNLD